MHFSVFFYRNPLIKAILIICFQFYMSPSLALVSLTVVPPIVGVAIIYGRFVRKITKAVQVRKKSLRVGKCV